MEAGIEVVWPSVARVDARRAELQTGVEYMEDVAERSVERVQRLEAELESARTSLGNSNRDVRTFSEDRDKKVAEAAIGELKDRFSDPVLRTTDECYELYATTVFPPDQAEQREELVSGLVGLRDGLLAGAVDSAVSGFVLTGVEENSQLAKVTSPPFIGVVGVRRSNDIQDVQVGFQANVIVGNLPEVSVRHNNAGHIYNGDGLLHVKKDEVELTQIVDPNTVDWLQVHDIDPNTYSGHRAEQHIAQAQRIVDARIALGLDITTGQNAQLLELVNDQPAVRLAASLAQIHKS